MNKHFLQQIQIKNFKCFDDFKADGLGRVNLIGGKNRREYLNVLSPFKKGSIQQYIELTDGINEKANL